MRGPGPSRTWDFPQPHKSLVCNNRVTFGDKSSCRGGNSTNASLPCAADLPGADVSRKRFYAFSSRDGKMLEVLVADDTSFLARPGGHSQPPTLRDKDHSPGRTFTYAPNQMLEKVMDFITPDALKGEAKRPETAKVLGGNSDAGVECRVNKVDPCRTLLGRRGRRPQPRTRRGNEHLTGMTTKEAPNPAPLKKGLEPGTIVSLLTGHLRGERAAYLKDLGSGEITITGPFAISGVPERRVTQESGIGTSTKAGVGGADCAAINKTYSKWDKAVRERNGEDAFNVKEHPVNPDEINTKERVMEEKRVKAIKPNQNM